MSFEKKSIEIDEQCLSPILIGTKKQILGFDLLKFVMAFFIVAIHTNFADAVSVGNSYMGKAIRVLQDLGVPVFFVISSMLFFRKCSLVVSFDESWRNYLHFVKRLTFIYGVYFVLQLPIITRSKGYLTMDFPIFISEFIKDLFLRYTFSGSWFLSALVIAVTIVFLLYNKVTSWLLLGVFFMLHLYLYNSVKFPEELQYFIKWYELNIRDIHLSFPNALVWVSLGACLANSKTLEYISKMKRFYLYCVLVFAVSFFMEYFAVFVRGIGMFFMVVCLIVLFYNIQLKNSVIFRCLREYSVLMFFWHFIVIWLFGWMCKRLFGIVSFDILNIFGMYFFPIILVITITVSSVILWAENKHSFGWLKCFH